MTIADFVANLNEFITFRANAAMSPSALPTAQTVLEHAVSTLTSVITLRHHVCPSEVHKLFIWVDLKRQDEGTFLRIIRVTPLGLTLHYCFLLTETEISGFRTVRSVAAVSSSDLFSSLSNFIEDCRQKAATLTFEELVFLWESAPYEFRRKYPICPRCGSLVAPRLLPDADKYRMFCSNCDFASRQTMMDYGEIFGVYVEDWFLSERRRVLKEDKASQERKAALSNFEEAITKALEAGVTPMQLNNNLEYILKKASGLSV